MLFKYKHSNSGMLLNLNDLCLFYSFFLPVCCILCFFPPSLNSSTTYVPACTLTFLYVFMRVKHLCVCVCDYTRVCCVMRPSPVLSHLSNYSARLSCWPVGSSFLILTACSVGSTKQQLVRQDTGGCPFQHHNNTLLHLVFKTV